MQEELRKTVPKPKEGEEQKEGRRGAVKDQREEKLQQEEEEEVKVDRPTV